MSCPPLAYPSSGEFNVLVQRFKLLNLVQRVAHRDVSEMLDTVGLEGLSRKGVLSRWASSDLAVDDGDASIDATVPGQGGAPRYQFKNRPGTSPSMRRVSPSLRGRSVSPARMQFGRPASGVDAQITAARWRSGMKEVSSAADSNCRPHIFTRGNTAGEADASERLTTKRRRYVVRRPHHVLHRTPSEREAFFSRLAEPRHRPDAPLEEVLLYDEAVARAHGRHGDVDARSSRDTADHYAPAFVEHDRRGKYDGYTNGGSRGGAFTSATPATQQRRPSLDAYAYYHKDLRAHYHAPLQPSISPPHWVADGRSDTRSRENLAGETDNYEATLHSPPGQLHPQRNDSTGGDSHEFAFIRPPLRFESLDASPSSLEGLARMRNNNFASLDQADAAAATPNEGYRHGDKSTAEASVRKSRSLPEVATADAGTVRSTAAGGDVTLFPVTAPTVMLPQSVGGGTTTDVTPTVPQLRLPQARTGGGDVFVVADATHGSGSASVRMPNTDSESPRAAAANSGSTSTSQAAKSPRVARGLAPKAKPKGAVEGTHVPPEAVRHASALLSRSSSFHPSPTMGSRGDSAHNSYAAGMPLQQQQQQQQQQQPYHSSARSTRTASGFGGGIPQSPRPHTVTVHNSMTYSGGDDADSNMPEGTTSSAKFRTAVSPLGLLPPPDGSAFVALPTGNQVSATSKKSFEELASAIDDMLVDHQQLLRQVYKGSHATSRRGTRQPGRSPAADRPSQKVDTISATDEVSLHASSFEVDSEGLAYEPEKAARYTDGVGTPTEMDFDSDVAVGNEDAPLHTISAEVEDEMLIYTQLQQQLTQLDADMARLGLETVNDGVAEDIHGETSDGARRVSPLGRSASMMQTSSSKIALVHQPARPQRTRGEVPDAIVQRLCAYRMNNFQYIAYNERLWNTSSISQFVFAQRLTAALAEECWSEVMAEVGSIMDEYVDGLADHELQ
ncbi:hypothetical protein, conserved [Leishmania tarentolae]|uniref:Uncharacterized protein n=1 Tax=Leishmania tarentolae TaxID=5689 RepID=A0A640KES4_LEITA|nr:hypothetical protein, conserved [Leishmania tarentolae]